MAITLVTGVPGSGKTAWVVDYIIDLEGKRPITVDGIPDLQLDADAAPVISNWTEKVADDSSQSGEKLQFTFPVGSLVVIDECQRVFPRRAQGKAVPDYVAAFETHRHLGLDFILITQHPRLVDNHVRSLVGRHVHIRQTWQGRHKYEWAECTDPDSKAARDLAARDRYALPKRVFSRYKSAEVHTKQSFKIPRYAYFLLVALSIIGIGGYYLAGSVMGRIHGDTAKAGPSKPMISGGPVQQASANLSISDYHASFVPRLPGVQHTAPAYDAITAPVDAPIPVGCVQKADSCRCIDQQGNNYFTTSSVCEGFVKNGMFIPWRNVAQERKDAQMGSKNSEHGQVAPAPAQPVQLQSPNSV